MSQSHFITRPQVVFKQTFISKRYYRRKESDYLGNSVDLLSIANEANLEKEINLAHELLQRDIHADLATLAAEAKYSSQAEDKQITSSYDELIPTLKAEAAFLRARLQFLKKINTIAEIKLDDSQQENLPSLKALQKDCTDFMDNSIQWIQDNPFTAEYINKLNDFTRFIEHANKLMSPPPANLDPTATTNTIKELQTAAASISSLFNEKGGKMKDVKALATELIKVAIGLACIYILLNFCMSMSYLNMDAARKAIIVPQDEILKTMYKVICFSMLGVVFLKESISYYNGYKLQSLGEKTRDGLGLIQKGALAQNSVLNSASSSLSSTTSSNSSAPQGTTFSISKAAELVANHSVRKLT